MPLLNFCFFVVVLFGFTIAAEEFCKDYPGDVFFSYETTEDEYNYNYLYGSKVIYHYRKMHKKKIIRPLSTRTSYPRQQIVQQQVQNEIGQLNNMNKNVDATAEETWQGKESENDTDQLPIWKLTVPRNAIGVNVERVEDGKSSEKFELDMDTFQNKTTTTYTSSAYTKSIDVTAHGITSDSWYAVCLTMSISEKKKFSKCSYCTLIKTSTTGFQDKVLAMKEIPEFFTTDSVRIKYEVNDLPFPEGTIITKVFVNYEAVKRCLNVGEIAASAESADAIQADTVTYVDLHGLSEASEYSITSALIAPWKDDSKRAPLTAFFYLNPEKKQTIPKCSRIAN